MGTDAVYQPQYIGNFRPVQQVFPPRDTEEAQPYCLRRTQDNYQSLPAETYQRAGTTRLTRYGRTNHLLSYEWATREMVRTGEVQGTQCPPTGSPSGQEYSFAEHAHAPKTDQQPPPTDRSQERHPLWEIWRGSQLLGTAVIICTESAYF